MEPKKYRVELTRVCYQYADVEVEANSEDEAKELAYQRAEWEDSNNDPEEVINIELIEP